MARRGSQALEAALHQAIMEELFEVGYLNLTFEGVARRARASKPTLYRRYRSRAHMVFEAFTARQTLFVPEASAGTLRADLVAMLRHARETFQLLGPSSVRGILAEADDELLQAFMTVTDRVTTQIRSVVLSAAQSRGELGPGAISEEVAALPIRLFRERLMVSEPTDREIAAIVDEVCLPLLRCSSTTTQGR